MVTYLPFTFGMSMRRAIDCWLADLDDLIVREFEGVSPEPDADEPVDLYDLACTQLEC